jgi:hypothetical protein
MWAGSDDDRAAGQFTGTVAVTDNERARIIGPADAGAVDRLVTKLLRLTSLPGLGLTAFSRLPAPTWQPSSNARGGRCRGSKKAPGS